jgi:hypothetical protein
VHLLAVISGSSFNGLIITVIKGALSAIAGVIALAWIFRPRVEISNISKVSIDGVDTYRVKVRNRSRLFSLRIEILQIQVALKGAHPQSPATTYYFYLPAVTEWFPVWRPRDERMFPLRVRELFGHQVDVLNARNPGTVDKITKGTSSSLEHFLGVSPEGGKLHIGLSVAHGVTGQTKTIVRSFDVKDIISGPFKLGSTHILERSTNR